MPPEAALLCLTLNVYHESRGESLTGQFAVAHVTLNRTGRNLDKVCSVVYANKQFSWTSDNLTNNMKDKKAKTQASKVALVSMFFSYWDITKGGTHYHSDSVNPKWSNSLFKVGHIGRHIIYRSKK